MQLSVWSSMRLEVGKREEDDDVGEFWGLTDFFFILSIPDQYVLHKHSVKNIYQFLLNLFNPELIPF
jgi:hypothetical protein